VLLVGCGPSVPDVSIHAAAGEGNIEVVKQHIAAGADVNANSDDGRTPLDRAIKKTSQNRRTPPQTWRQDG